MLVTLMFNDRSCSAEPLFHPVENIQCV
jgi:hypothetical protein